MLFLLTCLAAFIAAFLVMIAVQLIRTEKALSAVVELTEHRVKGLYGRK